MPKLKLTDDEIRDISIKIVDEFVNQGLCPDCKDTDNETEFEYQDIITDVLTETLNTHTNNGQRNTK